MRELFAWQMLGDTLKMASWILGYLMLGQAMIKLFMMTEIIFSASFVGLTWILTSWIGFQGVVIAFALNYALQLCFMYFSLRLKGTLK